MRTSSRLERSALLLLIVGAGASMLSGLYRWRHAVSDTSSGVIGDWSMVIADVAVVLAVLGVLLIRDRRVREATERVIGRPLGPQEPVATAWLRWARSVREQSRLAMRERRDAEVVLENMGEGILVLDEHQQIRRINPAAERLLGLSRESILDRYYREVLPQQDLIRFIGSVLEAGHKAEVDLKFGERNGKYVQASGQILVPQDVSPKGRLDHVGMVVVLNEVTRVRRLERARRDFVANVSHELKTPITSIQGFVETLVDGAIDNRDDALRFLGIIKRQSARLGQIINDMLTLSRIESEQDLEAAPADLYTLATSVVHSLDWRARERGVTVQVYGGSVRAMVNGQLIEQALSNLVDNAIKYGAGNKHGKPGRVELSIEQRGKMGFISVSDNGPGIDVEHLPRIFERFYRVDKGRSRAEGGTGLGLAIVKHIAQAHGGSASVVSEVGKGTTFTLEIPLELVTKLPGHLRSIDLAEDELGEMGAEK